MITSRLGGHYMEDHVNCLHLLWLSSYSFLFCYCSGFDTRWFDLRSLMHHRITRIPSGFFFKCPVSCTGLKTILISLNTFCPLECIMQFRWISEVDFITNGLAEFLSLEHIIFNLLFGSPWTYNVLTFSIIGRIDLEEHVGQGHHCMYPIGQ